jgi:hypothetical protein
MLYNVGALKITPLDSRGIGLKNASENLYHHIKIILGFFISKIIWGR